jgi:class 3 adenylate cyclase
MALEKSILSGKGATARADRKRAAVFFSDIVSFTARCERYTPREIVTQINALFEVMTRVIMDNDGDIDKFIGDACMAIWMHEDLAVAAECAVRSYVLLRRAIDAMNRESPMLAADPIHIRVGLNGGDLILCDLGSAKARIDLTVIGDSVNIAARLESASKQYGLDNLMGGAVVRPVMDRYGVRLIDVVRVKGKREPVECYEIFGPKAELTPPQMDLIRAFSAGIDRFRDGAFDTALAAFQASALLEARQEEGEVNPSRVYIDRCRWLLEHPPARWDGIWELHAK